MNYLFYSKKFRKNLFKWLFMYFGFLLLFTTVVTYSRYISNLTTNDYARPAKFNVKVNNYGICDSSNYNYECNYGLLRPQDKLEYYFEIDTRELEVSTTFVTLITIDENFGDYVLYNVTDNKLLEDGNDYIVKNNKIIITENLRVVDTYIRKYKLTVSYKNLSSYNETKDINNAVIIGYSAIQKED